MTVAPFPSHTSILADGHVGPGGENLVFLLGAPRSGTSWLAKIFDSHPGVLYRHEPDTALRSHNLPYLCSREDVPRFREEARRYVLELMNVRTLKSVGSLPLFPKSYYGRLAYHVHEALVLALRAADALSRGKGWPRRVNIPDLIGRNRIPHPKLVIKSVGSRGRARLYADAFPKSRIIFILRHPCGQVASMIRGIKSNQFERTDSLNSLLATDEAKALNLIAEHAAKLPPVEQHAWHWAILNQKTLNDLSDLDEERVKVIRYEDACADPQGIAKELLAFARLDWNEQTSAFVHNSATGPDTDEYYRVSRNSLAAAYKWRTTLSPQDQQRILEIAKQVPAGRLFATTETNRAVTG
jgi:hypothetical protein